MSAVIRCEILGGTDIEKAYYDCASIGGATSASVSCVFNGVEMFWTYTTPLSEWIAEYHRKIGKSCDERKEARDAKAEA